MKKHRLSLIIIALIAFSTPEIIATNGYRSAAFGYRVGTAGSGSAMPMDATDSLVNPALIAFIPNQAFISAGVFSPHRFMDTSAAPIGNPAGRSNSKTTIFPDGSLAIKYAPECSRWSYGLTLSGSGGLHTNFPNSRINPALLGGNYDNNFYYRILNLGPVLAFRSCDGTFAIGITPTLSFSDLKTSSAISNGAGGFRETSGNNQWDNAWGIGGRFGVVAQLNCMLSFSFSAQMPTFYQRFNKYRDVLASALHFPASFIGGLAFSPWDGTTLLFDYEFIYHAGTKLLRLDPEQGGFGWKNLNVFKVGLVQEFYCFILRLGYNYSHSPIPKDRVFANVLAPAIVEHHIAAGLSYIIDDCNIISLSGYYVPKKTFTDSGTGDIFSQLGKGTQIGMWQYDIQLAYQYNF